MSTGIAIICVAVFIGYIIVSEIIQRRRINHLKRRHPELAELWDDSPRKPSKRYRLIVPLRLRRKANKGVK